MTGQLLGWCLVANVAGPQQRDRPVGRSGGIRHFSAGTKVWVLPPQWGDGGEKVFVVGRHRGQRGGVVRMVVGRTELTSFRARGVYSPMVMRELQRPWHPDVPQAKVWSSRAEVEAVVRSWTARAVEEPDQATPATPARAGTGLVAGPAQPRLPARWIRRLLKRSRRARREP